MKKVLVLFIILGLIVLNSKTKTVGAVDTALGVTINSGSLTIGNTTASSATFESKNISYLEQTTTAIIGDTNPTNSVGIEVSDSRGTGVGWAATMTSTNLVTQGVGKTLVGTNDAVNFTGTYNGVGAIFTNFGFYTIEITTGGATGDAIFTWTNPAGIATTGVFTASVVPLSSGIIATFDPSAFTIGDKWSIAVDALRYNYNTIKGLTITPSALHVVSGSATGVTPGSSTLLTGSGATSNPVTILTAATDGGMGDYFLDLELSQDVHPNTYTGTYTATATITVS
jgi:hypothetical protein